jgi:hypothetical protein
MPCFSGFEATKLAYLAECPQAEDRYVVIEQLEGVTKEIAEVLIGLPAKNTVIEEVAKAIQQWAARKGKR